MGSSGFDDRAKNYILQVRGSVFYKVLGVFASFVSLPLTIHYLGQTKFGVWTTLLSIITWMILFDFGIGNGLKNEIAESLAKSDFLRARKFISSGYSIIGVIAISILVLFLVFSYFIEWQEVFNTSEIAESNLRLSVQISAVFILLNFWFGLINSLLGALQKTSVITLNQAISSLLSLVFVYILSLTTNGEIWKLSIVYGLSLCAPNIIATLVLFNRRPEFKPRFSINLSHWRALLGVGSQFFIIQLAVMVIFLTDKILITQIFGPEYVAQYEVIFKLFSIITLTYSLISTPLWSAYTDAHHRMDYQWIVKMLRRQIFIYVVVVFATIVLVLLSGPIVRLWIGPDLEISFALVFSMAIFVLISSWNNIFAVMINGIGRIKPQLYSSVFAMIINIPLAFLFTKYFDFGISGVVIATCVSLLISAIVLPLQVRMIIKEYLHVQ